MAHDSDEQLTFRWSGITDEQLSQAGLGTIGKEHLSAARRAMAAHLVCAHHAGRRISYSRDRNHYARLRLYEGLGYSYSNVTRLVEEFATGGLIIEDRAPPRPSRLAEPHARERHADRRYRAG
jgi:hypothetical protein